MTHYKIGFRVPSKQLDSVLGALATAGVQSVMVRLDKGAVGTAERQEPLAIEAEPQRSPELAPSPLALSVEELNGTYNGVSHTVRRGPAQKPYEYANGKVRKDITGYELALKFLTEAKRPVSTEELREEFAQHDFQPHSYSTAVHQLVTEGKVKHIARGRYCVAGLVIHK